MSSSSRWLSHLPPCRGFLCPELNPFASKPTGGYKGCVLLPSYHSRIPYPCPRSRCLMLGSAFHCRSALLGICSKLLFTQLMVGEKGPMSWVAASLPSTFRSNSAFRTATSHFSFTQSGLWLRHSTVRLLGMFLVNIALMFCGS